MPSLADPGSSVVQAASDVLNTAAQEIPDEVAAWLARLVLLYGVPFSYLIPDQGMLPKESIRFFFLDPVWIQCLIQGACSIGNSGYGDTLVDRAMNRWAQPNQPRFGEGGSPVNSAAAGVRDRLRNEREGVELPKDGAVLDWPLTGFLLRSAVVAGWRGLEILAYKELSDAEKRNLSNAKLTEEQREKLEKDGVAPLKALRIEQLSPDVMLGVFNGIIGQLVIRQPQEGLHFGLTVADGSYTKTLRELGYKTPANAGEILQREAVVLSGDNLVRDQRYRGVINVGALAAEMKRRLSALGQLRADRFTSAEFAVEMIEAAGEFTFILGPK